MKSVNTNYIATLTSDGTLNSEAITRAVGLCGARAIVSTQSDGGLCLENRHVVGKLR